MARYEFRLRALTSRLFSNPGNLKRHGCLPWIVVGVCALVIVLWLSRWDHSKTATSQARPELSKTPNEEYMRIINDTRDKMANKNKATIVLLTTFKEIKKRFS